MCWFHPEASKGSKHHGWSLFTVNPVNRLTNLGKDHGPHFTCADQCNAATLKSRNELFRSKTLLRRRKHEGFVPLQIVRSLLDWRAYVWSQFFKKKATFIGPVERLSTRVTEGQVKINDYATRIISLWTEVDRMRLIDRFFKQNSDSSTHEFKANLAKGR